MRRVLSLSNKGHKMGAMLRREAQTPEHDGGYLGLYESSDQISQPYSDT